MSVYRGIDVSRLQNEINWILVKNSGVQFAMLRSSYGWGGKQQDLFFKTNYEMAKKVGIAVGAYHYSYAATVEEARMEADYCRSVLRGKKFGYPIAYRMCEPKTAALGRERVSAIAGAFCERMAGYGYYTCLFAHIDWLNTLFTDDIFERYEIWLSHHSEQPDFTKPYGIWQRSADGEVDGIIGAVNIDEAYKNYPAIMKYNGLNGYGSEEPLPPSPPHRGFWAGERVTLKNARLYSSAMAETVSGTVSGTYYIYDGVYMEGRYRITASLSDVERKPISKHITGFVERDELRACGN